MNESSDAQVKAGKGQTPGTKSLFPPDFVWDTQAHGSMSWAPDLRDPWLGHDLGPGVQVPG